LAALAALKDAKFPKYDKKTEKVDYNAERTKTALPLIKTPVSCTMGILGKQIIVDPTVEEEEILDGRLTVVTLDDGTICAMQKGGEKTISADMIANLIDTAIVKCKEMRRPVK